MIRSAYKLLLRMPAARGRHRIDALLRRWLNGSPDQLSSGLKMRLDPLEWTQISLLSGRPTEPETAARIEALLEPGDSFVDIGAHIGWLSLLAARRVGSTGRVVAIDPQPYNCERILSNAVSNGFKNILVVPLAVGDYDGFVELSQQSVSDKSRLTLAGSGANDTGFKFLCRVIRLDTLFELIGGGPIKLLKIDVEGFEPEVLQGATAMLDQVENVIYEALSDTENSVHEKVATLLETAGFSLGRLDGAPWWPGDPAPENNVWASRRAARISRRCRASTR